MKGNIISSHVLYKARTDESGTHILKPRLVLHGNHDDEKDLFRKDAATAQLNIIRLLLSITAFLNFRLGTADIKGAYLRSGQMKPDIYVTPPEEWSSMLAYQRRAMWRLTNFPYRIVAAGRQLQLTIQNWRLCTTDFMRINGFSHFFVKRDNNHRTNPLVAKVTDEFLCSGDVTKISHFMDCLSKRFMVGKTFVDKPFNFIGCEVHQDREGNVRLTMLRYVERISIIAISEIHKKERIELATKDEIRQYRGLAGTQMYLGGDVFPRAELVTFLMQQKLPRMLVQHLVNANGMVK